MATANVSKNTVEYPKVFDHNFFHWDFSKKFSVNLLEGNKSSFVLNRQISLKQTSLRSNTYLLMHPDLDFNYNSFSMANYALGLTLQNQLSKDVSINVGGVLDASIANYFGRTGESVSLSSFAGLTFKEKLNLNLIYEVYNTVNPSQFEVKGKQCLGTEITYCIDKNCDFFVGARAFVAPRENVEGKRNFRVSAFLTAPF